MPRAIPTSPPGDVQVLAAWIGTAEDEGCVPYAGAEMQAPPEADKREQDHLDDLRRRLEEDREMLNQETRSVRDERQRLEKEKDQRRERRISQEAQLENDRGDRQVALPHKGTAAGLGGGALEGLEEAVGPDLEQSDSVQADSVQESVSLRDRFEELQQTITEQKEHIEEQARHSDDLSSRAADQDARIRELELERRWLFQRYWSAKDNIEVIVRVRPVTKGKTVPTIALRKDLAGKLEIPYAPSGDTGGNGIGQRLRAGEIRSLTIDRYFPKTVINEVVLAEVFMLM